MIRSGYDFIYERKTKDAFTQAVCRTDWEALHDRNDVAANITDARCREDRNSDRSFVGDPRRNQAARHQGWQAEESHYWSEFRKEARKQENGELVK